MKKIYLKVRAAILLLVLVMSMLIYMSVGAVICILYHKSSKRRLRLIKNGQIYCKVLIKIFKIKLICHNPIPKDEISLLVGNHVGFIDIVCLQAIEPSVFITSLEMRKTPGLGQVCEIGGCAYVDRKNRMKIQDELKDIVYVLHQGFRVVLYAESVASDGEQVLPFKKTLMMAAGLAGVPIRPFVFNFRSINNKPVQFKYRDSVCWHGDMSFATSLWNALQLETITCEIEFLPLVYTTPQDDRTEVARYIHQLVSEKYVPFVDPAKLKNNL